MKRQQDRETPPRTKRSRSVAYSGHDRDSVRDRMSPDIDRRDRNMRKSPRPRSMNSSRDGRDPKPYRDFDHDFNHGGRKPYRNDRMNDMYDHGRNPDQRQFGGQYWSLCISNISRDVPDQVLKDTVQGEFDKFGVFNVRITFNGENRVAYVNFRYSEDAKEAKHAKQNLYLFDRLARVHSVYKKIRSNSPGPSEFMRDHQMNHGPRPPGPRQSGPYPGMGRRPPPMNRPIGRDQPPDHDFMHDKFPHHLRHVLPEDDEKATRTLFVGNLEHEVSEDCLKEVFEKFGVVEDVDIKRPNSQGPGNSLPYAFVKFNNLDCAHRAKVEMSGQYIGKYQCKIGYGKVTPTKCLWVGGLGSWVTYQTLETEFDRFGVIHKIEWPHGKNYAYVLYDNLDAAQAACQEMRGFPLGGQDRRLRVDFADASHITTQSPQRTDDGFVSDNNEHGRNHKGHSNQWRNTSYDGPNHPSDDDHVDAYRNPDNPRDFEGRKGKYSGEGDATNEMSDRRKRPRTPDEFADRYAHRSRTPDRRGDRDMDPRNANYNKRSQDKDGFGSNDKDKKGDSDVRTGQPSDKSLNLSDNVGSVMDLAKCLPVAWNGALVLKSKAFSACMHVVSGDVTIVDNLMRDPTTTETPVLKITQRLRLDPPKLDEVSRRVSASGSRGHCILLALPSTLENYEDASGATQPRPLRNLVTYLNQKEAAGVISLPPNPSKDKDNIGVLHAFPPCQFGYDFLFKRAPKMPSEVSKEDYLVVVVVRGAT